MGDPGVPRVDEFGEPIESGTGVREPRHEMLRCHHEAGDSSAGGWHHHAGPHACDDHNHGGLCPYWAQHSEDPLPA